MNETSLNETAISIDTGICAAIIALSKSCGVEEIEEFWMMMECRLINQGFDKKDIDETLNKFKDTCLKLRTSK